MHCGRLSGQYGRLSSFTTCWWAGEECRAAVMYGMHWWSRERRATSICSRLRRSPAASRNLTHICKGGCSFSVNVVVTLSLTRPFPHMFFPNTWLLKNNRVKSHIFIFICMYRQSKINLCQCISIYTFSAYFYESFIVGICYLSHFSGSFYPLNF